MARSAGISGVGVAAATAGALLMFAGIRDVPILEALRDITGGKLPEGNKNREGQPGAAATAARAVLDSAGGPAGGATDAVQVGAGGMSGLAKAALKYLGRPYKWGGTGPDRFDCSGLVQRAFADIGIEAPRTTYQQQAWRALSRIDASQAAAGDLVFWPGHVAIVVSPGTVVHAPNSRSVVKTSPVGSAGPRGTTPTYKRYTAGGGEKKQQRPPSARV